MSALDQIVQQARRYVQTNGIENVRELQHLLAAYEEEDWKRYVNTAVPKSPILFQDEYLKIVLIGWKGFQKSAKHGHPGEGGLIKILSGTLLETRFDPAEPERVTGKYQYKVADLAYIHDDIALHVVENPSAAPAVSLHCYVLQAKAKNTPLKERSDNAEIPGFRSAA